MMNRERMLFVVRKLLSGRKASPQTLKVLGAFLQLPDDGLRALEVSSDSTYKTSEDYLRMTVFLLDRAACAGLLTATGFSPAEIERLLISDPREACFGFGVSAGRRASSENRVKIYNFYHRSRRRVDVQGHLKKICRHSGVSYAMVCKDLEGFKSIPFSSVDVYQNGQAGVKVYSDYCLSKAILSKYKGMFKAPALERYAALVRTGALPATFLFCFRYAPGVRSVRTDFFCNSVRVLPYLEAFDPQGAGTRLYEQLLAMKMKVRLTYMGIDVDARPRTQFNFSIS